MLPVEQPFKTYTGLDGKPLENGYIYFGQPNLNPVTNPATVYWDEAGTIPAAQPLRTVGGYIMRAGTPANVYLDGAYSILVQDSKKRQVFLAVSSAAFAVGPIVAGLADAFGSSLIGFSQTGVGAVRRSVQDRLRDSFHVKDYGLKGDGTTGDRAALAALLVLMEGRGRPYELVFTDGDYLLDSSITIPSTATLEFAAGARLVIPTGTTLTLNAVELKAGLHKIFSYAGGTVVGTIRNALIYPEWWGAIADGLHPPVGADFSARAAAAANNTGPIQAALNFAGNQYAINGLTGTVQLTYGYYLIDGTLSVPLSVNLVGYGIGSGLFYYAPTGNAVECVSTNNTMLKDFFIAPIAGPTWNYSTGFGLYMDGVSTPIVDNIWSSGFGGGTFFFKSVIEGRIRGCISDNSNGPAFTIRGVGQGTVLENCVTAGVDNGACFDIQSGYDWHLIGCTAKDGPLGTVGFYLNACENINLTACGAHEIARQGIVTTASTLNCTINGCFVNGASTSASGAYPAMDISGTRNKLIAPKVTQNTPTYSYALVLGGGATDCSYTEENFTPGTLGGILDAQPSGANTTKVRKVSTVDATPVTIWKKALNNNAGATFEALINVKQRGVAGATASFKIWCNARTGTSGTALMSPSAAVFSYKSDPLLAAAFVVTDATANAGVVSLQITGLASGGVVDWEAMVTVISANG